MNTTYTFGRHTWDKYKNLVRETQGDLTVGVAEQIVERHVRYLTTGGLESVQDVLEGFCEQITGFANVTRQTFFNVTDTADGMEIDALVAFVEVSMQGSTPYYVLLKYKIDLEMGYTSEGMSVSHVYPLDDDETEEEMESILGELKSL